MISRSARRARTALKGVRKYAAQAQLTKPVAAPEAADNATDLNRFLRLRTPYTLLPTPLPDDRTSPAHAHFFPQTPTQDLLAVVDACLHARHDVPRARQVFNRLRTAEDAALEPRVFNAFLEAYLEMAGAAEEEEATVWLDEMWSLYESMEAGQEKAEPTTGTYAAILLAIHRFPGEPPRDGPRLLSAIVERGLPIASIAADRILPTSSDASAILTLLSRAAVSLNLPHIVRELGAVTALAASPDPLASIPEVKPVLKATKVGESEEGEAVIEEEIPFNLDTLRRHLAHAALARRVLPEDVAARQKLLESSVYDVAVERLKHQAERISALGIPDGRLRAPDLQQWMWDWHGKLVKRLEQEIRDVAAAEKLLENKSRQATKLSPFLALVKPTKLSLITILELMRLHGSGGVADGMKTARALLAVGRSVEVESLSQRARRSNAAVPATSESAEYFTEGGIGELRERRKRAERYLQDVEGGSGEWTQVLRVKIGSILVNCLMEVARVERTAVDKRTGLEVVEEQPAFFHSYEYLRGQKLGIIRLNQVVGARIALDQVRETLHPRHLPMLVKPKPWLSHNQGGYLFNKTSAMRFKDSAEQQSYLRQAAKLGNVELVFAGLDVLGSTPWRINAPLFDVVLTVWNSGDRMCKVPPAMYDVPEPEKPAKDETDQKVKSVWIQRQKAWMQGKANNHSERCNVNYKIEIARAFLGDTMYLPHNLDFRGRAYPIPPHLNHIGDDLSRGMMLFGESKPLGVRGLRWLKIHLANLYGFDKANFDEREAWSDARLDEIYDSAEKPLEGKRWWTKADDPWQCLATCMELRNALESPDPYAFESALPVHQDGTCNGLQHYAALGGDNQGAQQVNLAAGDRPSDVYTYVANMVERALEEDVKKGEVHAQALVGKIARKVVKQTVMTTVYGVTFIGAREQIEKQLKDRMDLPEEQCWQAASYLAKKVLECIGDLFSGARDIQLWLNLCARLIAKSIPPDRVAESISPATPSRQRRGTTPPATTETRMKKEQMTTVVWTTPLGLPIVQPYRKTKRKQIMTALQTVYISDPNAPAEVNSQKQASAFPPNFIHSLDATHMMLTALGCRMKDLTFASVHDSYWTHASTIDDMSEIIRDTFVSLHSSDILTKLLAEFKERYAGYKVPLVHLRAGSLARSLAAAGTKIVASKGELEVLLAGDADSEDGEADAGKPKKRTRRTKTPAEGPEDEERKLAEMAGKFVELADLLPPLPKKGDFDVKSIKASQYFFS